MSRLIPAHAGKTCRRLRSAPSGPAHPRSRGENRITRTTRVIAAGSSPLTRGKREMPRSPDRTGRLIPAHAGKTRTLQPKSWGPPAHPRSRGENGPDAPLGTLRAGSSPLTRGKLTGIPSMVSSRRLIPAHAGKTTLCEHMRVAVAAHPRSRGENSVMIWTSCRGSGSSPLTRGKPWKR